MEVLRRDVPDDLECEEHGGEQKGKEQERNTAVPGNAKTTRTSSELAPMAQWRVLYLVVRSSQIDCHAPRTKMKRMTIVATFV
jgi:hypothetical protein